VHVVRHQAIGKHSKSEASGVAVEQAQVAFWVAGANEDALAVIATLGDVVRNAREYDSALSWHGLTVARKCTRAVATSGWKRANMKGLVPFANMKGRVPFITAV
jgi:hypothetical protein